MFNASFNKIFDICQVERAAAVAPYMNGDLTTSSTASNAALRDRVAGLEDKIHNLYQILTFQAVVLLAALLYKILL